MQYDGTAANYQAQKIFFFPPLAAFYLLSSKELTPRSRKLAVKSFHFSCCESLLNRNKSRRATFSSFLINRTFYVSCTLTLSGARVLLLIGLSVTLKTL